MGRCIGCSGTNGIANGGIGSQSYGGVASLAAVCPRNTLPEAGYSLVFESGGNRGEDALVGDLNSSLDEFDWMSEVYCEHGGGAAECS